MDVTEPDLRAVLPHLARLGTVLGRSRLVEHAVEQAGGDLDRPTISILTTLNQAGEPLRIGEIAERMRVAGRTSRGRCTCWSDGGSCAGSPTSTTGGPAPSR